MTSKKEIKVCSSPWVSLAINVDKSFSLCCYTMSTIEIGNWNSISIKEAFNSNEMKEYRNSFLEGKRIEACSGCYKSEDNKLQSKRDEFIENYPLPLGNNDFSYSKLKHLEIFLSNKCNFNCRTCGSIYSSSWNKDNIILGRDTHSYTPLTDSQLQELCEVSKHLSSIYIAGGEPLICKETYILLERFSKFNPNCQITINTNFSKLSLNDFNLIDLSRTLHSLSLNISIDGIADKGEYIRNGLCFKSFKKNLDTVSKTNIKVTFLVTISIFNIYDLEDIFHFILEEQPVEDFEIVLNFVSEPCQQNIQILPEEIKSLIQANLYALCMNYASIPNYKKYIKSLIGVVEYLKRPSTDSNLNEFYEEVCQLDKIRKQSFKDCFPQYFLILSKYIR
ncbi:twitch domain-containing radical SAM protein [Halobacteriovorax marinus]|uniref:twitch domain-containing radical SAM protein n=1 Tax=Halobacteriovorax marinus TaxID=97084 RepID=UPI003A928898